MPEQNQNQLVLAQLQSLSQGVELLTKDLQSVKQDIIKIKVKEDKVIELREWKQKIDEVASPTQLSKFVQDIQDLNNFKTKAVTIFAVVQFGMGVVLFAMNFID